MNDLSFNSSDRVGGIKDRVLGTPRNLNNSSSETAPNQSNPSKLSSENPCSRISPCVRDKEHEGLTVSVSREKTPGENLGAQTRNDGGFESSNM